MSNSVVSREVLNKCLVRYIWTRQSPFNYETMQSGGWCYSIYPALRAIYGDDDELIKAKLMQHFRFYNTHPWMGNPILGACIAVEETKEPDCTETAVDLRTALMGPLAGLGDSIIWVILPTIMGAIAAYSALEGSIIGWVEAEIVQMCVWVPFVFFFYVAHDKGVEFITSKSTSMANLTSAAGILGLSVVGALIASTVDVHFGIQLTSGEIVQDLDTLLNKIVPHFANIIATILIYLGLNKGMSTGKMVIICIVVGIVLGALGILA